METKSSAGVDRGDGRIPADEQLLNAERDRPRLKLRPVEGGTEPPVDFFADIEDFHRKFGIDYDGKPRVLPPETHAFRIKFSREEIDEHEEVQAFLFDETTKAVMFRDQAMIVSGLEKQLDALVDEMYVLLGTGYLQGFRRQIFEEAWRRVHRANMAKERCTDAALSTRGSTLDVIKPPGWTAPSHVDLIEDHAHRS